MDGESYNAATTFVDEPLLRGWGARVAFHHNDGQVTYREFAEQVNRAGNALRGLGVAPEDRVLLVLYDSPEFAASFFGAIKIGAVAVPVGTFMRSADYLFYLNDTRASVLVIHEPLLAEIEPIADRCPYLRHIIVVPDPDDPRRTSRHLIFADLLARASSNLEPAPTSWDAPALWLYTSGSTGTPKGVVHLQHDMRYCADTTGRYVFGYVPDDIAFSVSKLFFAYGLGNALYFPLRFGASAVHYPGRLTPERVFQVVHRYRPTLLFTVPTMYARLLQVPHSHEHDLTSVRMYVSSGEPLPRALFHRWQERFGADILDVIGSTENLHDFLANRPGWSRPGSSGVPVPGYECRIVDDAGRDVPAGEVGHLLVKGESTAPYYWNRDEATNRTMLGEWLRTGDMFYRDDDGFYWYCGRADDILKVGGMWVSPHDVENALLEHAAVLEAAVVGEPNADGLTVPSAYVVLKKGHAPCSELGQELQAHVKERLSSYKCPRTITFIDELPKTTTGKIQRFRLRSAAPPA